jgi:hypothetical protein
VLRGAAAAQSVEHVEYHRRARAPARHVESVGGFIADLRPRLIGKTGGDQIDDGAEPGHRRAGGEAAHA